MFGSLLERPLVAEDALDRYPLLVSMFDRELSCCKVFYNKHIQVTEELGEIYKTKVSSLWLGGHRNLRSRLLKT